MNSRTFRILLLGLLCLWFGVIMPGHERGQIVLPGGTGKSVTRSCCAMRGGELAVMDTNCDPQQQKQKPSREDQKRCALCQLIATLQVAQIPNLSLPPMGLLAISPPQRAIGVAHPAFSGPVLGRAPPAC